MSFNFQPSLSDELVELRPLLQEDYEALFAVASDPLIWEQHPAHNRYQPDVFKGFFADAINSGAAFLISDKQSGEVIGSSRYHGFDPEKSEVEIGWTFIARKCWGGKYNRQVKYLMLQHAFKNVKHVIFLVGPNNIRSQKAVEKLGGILIETRFDDDNLESNVFQISAADYTP